MPTVASLPSASSVSSSDYLPVSQVNEDESITLRKATAAQFAAGGGSVVATGAKMTGFLGLATVDTLTGAGSTQTTATLLDAQICVATSVPVNSGFVLPTLSQGNGFLAPITFLNKDPTNTALVYPPVGGQIDSYGTNTPVSVASGGQVTFIPGTATNQWWA